jgi:hypothetical protein
MNSLKYGSGVFFKKTSAEDKKEYREKLLNMPIEEFGAFVKGSSLEKSYETYKVNIRKKIIHDYHQNWIRYTYHTQIVDSLLNNMLDRKQMNTLVAIYMDRYTNNTLFKDGSFYRMGSISYPMIAIQPYKTRTICSVFSIKKTVNAVKTNYAYLYTDGCNDKYGSRHTHFCTGANLLSADGEYRGRFVDINTLKDIELEFRDVWADTEEYLIKKDYIFEHNHYMPNNNRELVDELHSSIESHRFALKLYLIAWLSQGLLVYQDIQAMHTDSSYNKNMFSPEDNKFIGDIISTYGVEKLKVFYWVSGYIHTGHHPINMPYQLRRNPTYGQKIIPIGDNIAVNDITDRTWAEIRMSGMVGDLFINMICPGVPIMHDWFLVYGADKWLYDNPVIHDKIDLSDEILDVLNKIGDHPGEDIRAEKLQKIKDELKEDLEDDTQLTVANTAVIVVSEYTGRTIGDISRIEQTSAYKDLINPMFASHETFSKYLFDIIYALMCLNTRLHIIQGDLHLNNTTVQYPSYINKENAHILEAKFMYVIDDKIFSFNNTNKIGTVIDYSRGFIVPPDTAEFHKIKQPQSTRIVNYYNRLFPEFMQKHPGKLEQTLEDDFKSVFVLFTAIDPYVHSEKLLKLIEINARSLPVDKKTITLLSKINQIAKFYLTTGMERLFAGSVNLKGKPGKKLSKNLYPNYDILMRCFDKYIVKTVPKRIGDIYFYNNPLKYSLREFDKLPPRFKFRKLKKKNSKSTDVSDEIPTFKNIKLYYKRRFAEEYHMTTAR